MKKFLALLSLTIAVNVTAQNFREEFDKFKQSNQSKYENFRKEANSRYADFLRQAWETYSAVAPVPRPQEPAPTPPVPYEEPVIEETVVEETVAPVEPVTVKPEEPEPQPLPVAPIKERETPDQKHWTFDFYGAQGKVRLPETSRFKLASRESNDIADAWERLSDGSLDNLVRDCLEMRIRNQLCDWAYLQMLNELARSFYGDTDEATLLTAWLFSQSGYQMRLGNSGDKLIMLFGSKHLIYDRRSFSVEGDSFYPYGSEIDRLKIAQVEFPGEKPLSLYIDNEPLTGKLLSDERVIQSRKYPGMKIVSQVKNPLIDFFDTYPTSAVGGNMMSRWAMYADTPLSKETKELIYPAIKAEIDSLSQLDAAQRLLNWVQTGLEYAYDDDIWGGDRAFFAEETLYYPYSDCEDRAILFSRLVRDLLDLDVALIYYPGHLATAVKFNDDVKGAKMKIDGAEFTVCDPTYIGAPVGKQMPGVDASAAQAVVLKR